MSDEPEALGNVRRLRKRSLGAVPADGAAANDDDAAKTCAPLPDGCPVIPIGVSGDNYYYLDQLGQLRELKAKDHSRLNLMALFGRRTEFIYAVWPRLKENQATGRWDVVGWKAEEAAECLMSACARLGVWSADEMVRGSGAWLGDGGELILHCGDELLMVPAGKGADRHLGKWMTAKPGMVNGMVYPTGAPGLKPDAMRQPGGPNGPAAEVLALFESWNWRRPTIDPNLLLGWVGAAMLGGAQDWRPTTWITGGANTGKSTLQKIVKNLLGPHGLMQTADASAASVRQTVKYASRPVALDEAESTEDNRKMQTLIKLARDAASGSMSYRGGTDHNAVSFTVRSCFMFSSILVPPLLGQDRSRIAVLELDKIVLTGKAKNMAGAVKKMEELGGKLLRRLVSQWWRFEETLQLYRDALARAGHSARGQDVFGTLLACQDCLLTDAVPTGDVLTGWQTKLRASDLAEIEGNVLDEDACLGHLLSSLLDNSMDRSRQTIGEWVMDAAESSSRDLFGADEKWQRCKTANKLLKQMGMRVEGLDGKQYLAVANFNVGLARIFQGTHWGAMSGAQGVWVQALRRIPGHIPYGKALHFGNTAKSTFVPIELCIERADAEMDVPPAPEPDGELEQQWSG